MPGYPKRKGVYLWADCPSLRDAQSLQTSGICLKPGTFRGCPGSPGGKSSGISYGSFILDTPDLQRILLEAEGVECYEDKPGRFRVDLKRFGWKNTMEEAAELQEKFAESGI